MKDRELNDLIMVEVIYAIKREIRRYSKGPECILKLKSPGDIRKFSNESLYQQLLVKCPKIAVLITSICQPGNLKGNMPLLSDVETTIRFRNAVCMATSICLHQHNQQLSATHYRMSLLLNGGPKALTLEHCSHLGICMSHPSAISIQKKASAPSSTKATSWKDDTPSKSLQIKFLKEVLKEKHSSHTDLSHDKAEGTHNSLVYPRHVVVSAVKDIEKSIVHYKQGLLGLDFLNTNKSGDMADLLKKFQKEYVPMKEDHRSGKSSSLVWENYTLVTELNKKSEPVQVATL
ncbi:unnamed protein product [Porites evermanni]|uniref:Uncharacterized protein n=1 Tax=Porites evermanni TaxID=104178 RepID=A0ABN8LUL5_9CNID|nr:unnamed protein product [Porites evermanni]